jgi:hypothetical protein
MRYKNLLCIKPRTKGKPSPIQLEPCEGPVVRSGSILFLRFQFFCLLLTVVHLRSDKTVEIKVFLNFFNWKDPDPDRSGRPKNFRILRIRIRNTVKKNNLPSSLLAAWRSSSKGGSPSFSLLFCLIRQTRSAISLFLLAAFFSFSRLASSVSSCSFLSVACSCVRFWSSFEKA